MPAFKLTRAFCDAASHQGGRQVAYPDSEVRGLELRVSGDGRKSWSYRYRTRLGKQCRLTLGLYSSAFGIAEARLAARRVQVQVDGGGDPAVEKRVARIEASLEHLKSFGDLADAYFQATAAGRYRQKRLSSQEHERRVYAVHIKSALATVPLEVVTRRLVKRALENMLDAGVTSQAVKAQAVIRQILAYGVNEERLPYNPIADLRPVVPANPRSRIYSDAELRAIWTGVQRPQDIEIPAEIARHRRGGARVTIGPPMRLALALVFLLLQRRCEVLGMAIAELDLDQGVWRIPAERMKSKRPHAVPLSPWAIRLIREAIDLNAGRDTGLVFPGRIRGDVPMTGPSMNTALDSVLLARGISDGTIHDIRRTGSTFMTSERLGVTPFIRSKVLGHNDAGGGAFVSATHYDANTYIAEKRQALEKWQGLLAEIVGEAGRTPAPADAAANPPGWGAWTMAHRIAPHQPISTWGRAAVSLSARV